MRGYTERIDGMRKSGAGLGYKHAITKGLDAELGADIWHDSSGTDYRATAGLTWRW